MRFPSSSHNTHKISRLGNRWKARIGMSVILLLVKSLKHSTIKPLNKIAYCNKEIFADIKDIARTKCTSHVSRHCNLQCMSCS